MDEDFSKLSRMFNAMRSVVRMPSIDPKYKIAVFASKQVSVLPSHDNYQNLKLTDAKQSGILNLIMQLPRFCRTTVLLICYMAGRMEDFLFT